MTQHIPTPTSARPSFTIAEKRNYQEHRGEDFNLSDCTFENPASATPGPKIPRELSPDGSPSKGAWPIPPTELEHRIRQAMASLRLEGHIVSEEIYEHVLNNLRNTSAAEMNATVAKAIAFVHATQ